MKKPLLIIQHTATETPNLVRDWAHNRVPYTVHKIFENPNLPKFQDYELIVLLGGTMNVDQDAEYPWLVEEKKWLREAILSNSKVLGLCLGGQLIARALGAEVTRAEHEEVGWQDVSIQSSRWLNNWPQQLTIYQWHQDTFEIPDGAKRVATNKACSNQIFEWGDTVLAFQSHPEANTEWIQMNYLNFERRKFRSLEHVQLPEITLQLTQGHIEKIRPLFFDLLTKMYGYISI